MAHILMPLPARDFDPTEVGVTWKVLTQRGHRVSFATPDGAPGVGDGLMLSGEGLDPWGFLPGLRRLKLIGLMLRANGDGRRAYGEMAASAEFKAPLRWADLRARDFDGLALGGGHRALGMRAYLESAELQGLVAGFFAGGKPVGAICHGVLLAARSPGADGRSVLWGRKTTALTWRLEQAADAIAQVGRFWDRGYYRTYPDGPGQPRGYMSVQQEVTRALAAPADFLDAAPGDADYGLKTSGTSRDTMEDGRCAFVVRDGNYVSARWPGDAHSFARTFADVLEGVQGW
ncbi:MAG TPA: type 1 glutamine amidotransferase domain-containing protein [Caulobacteraceae bacterium]